MTKNIVVETYYRENYDKLVKIARRRVGNYSIFLAEEAVQESFARALRYYKAYKEGESFDNWFKRILYNRINDVKTQEKDRGATYSENDEEQHHQGDVTFSKEIIDLLNSCSVRDKEILNMYFFYGFKSREIAELMSVGHDLVRNVIRLFRKQVVR